MAVHFRAPIAWEGELDASGNVWTKAAVEALIGDGVFIAYRRGKAVALANVKPDGSRALADSTTGFDRARPQPYTVKGREMLDRIRDELGDDGFSAYCLGTAMMIEGGGDNLFADEAVFSRRMANHVRGVGPDPRCERPNFQPYRRPS